MVICAGLGEAGEPEALRFNLPAFGVEGLPALGVLGLAAAWASVCKCVQVWASVGKCDCEHSMRMLCTNACLCASV